jgi:hypothetical protein
LRHDQQHGPDVHLAKLQAPRDHGLDQRERLGSLVLLHQPHAGDKDNYTHSHQYVWPINGLASATPAQRSLFRGVNRLS